MASRYPTCLIIVLLAIATGSAAGQGSQQALRFFGSLAGQQDRARIPIDDDQPGPDASARADVGAGSFSVELWLKGTLTDNPTAHGGGDTDVAAQIWRDGNILLDRDIQTGSGAEWGVSVAGGFVRFGTGGGDPAIEPDHTLEGDRLVLDGKWHHIACVRDVADGSKAIFVDGELDIRSAPGISTADLSYPDAGVAASTSPYDPYLVVAADKHGAGAPGFAGFVDELRLWSVARSQSEILSTWDRLIFNAAAGLAGWYRFEEGSGTQLADSASPAGPVGQLIAGVPGNGAWVAYLADPGNTPPLSFGLLPPGFQRSVVVTGLSEPTCIALLPDGRVLVGERSGAIRVVHNGVLQPTPLLTLATNNENGERGLLGLEVDPAFATDPYVYAFYTTTAPKDRVSRFQVSGNQASLASEQVLWEHDDPSSNYHHAGGLAFGTDQTLFIAVGDQLDSANAQDLTEYGGKILRVNKAGGVPVDNPFLGVPSVRPEIYAYGVRNPFRIAVDPADGTLFVGDVGGNTSDAYEEVDRPAPGANLGWPLQEGENCYTVDCSPFTAPIWSYPHDDAGYYFADPQGSVTLGPMYRGSAFPPDYRGNLYVADYANRFIRRLIFDDHGHVTADPMFLQTGLAGTPVDVKQGADGALYYVTFGLPLGGVPDTATVYRIAYVGSVNQPPIAIGAATPQTGAPPLPVQFQSTGTFDPDAGPAALTYLWDFGDGSISTAPAPLHVYGTAGPYHVRLTVDDGQDTTTAEVIDIAVGNAPVPIIDTPAPTFLYEAGQTVSFQGGATDVEDQSIPPAGLSWRVVLVHHEHTHPFLGPLNGVAAGSFTVPASGHGPEDTFYRVELTATDADGLSATTAVEVLPRRSLLSFGSIPPGVAIFLDGEPAPTPLLYQGLVGFQHALSAPAVASIGGVPHAFRCWSDGQPREHALIAPGAGQNLTALYEPLAVNETLVSVAAAERNAQHSPATGQAFQDASDPLALCVGRDGNGALQVGVEFTLPVPHGASILSAVLEVTATANQAITPKAAIRAFDVGNAPPFVAGSPTPITAHAPLTAGTIGWVLPQFQNGQTYASPDLATLVQAVVDRPDWTAGNVIGLCLDGSSTVNAQWRCFANFNSALRPRLRVTWAVLPASGGTCPLSCGFTTYGPPASAVHHLAQVGAGLPHGGFVPQLVTTGLGSAPGIYVFVGFGAGDLPFYGGRLLINPAQLVPPFFIPASAGEVQWGLPLSADPQYVGLTLYFQSVALDPALPIGVALSNGVSLTICPP